MRLKASTDSKAVTMDWIVKCEMFWCWRHGMAWHIPTFRRRWDIAQVCCFSIRFVTDYQLTCWFENAFEKFVGGNMNECLERRFPPSFSNAFITICDIIVALYRYVCLLSYSLRTFRYFHKIETSQVKRKFNKNQTNRNESDEKNLEYNSFMAIFVEICLLSVTKNK